MCGIAGAILRRRNDSVARAVVAVTRALAHRGPDDESFWQLGSDGPSRCSAESINGDSVAVFGHRRLSIVDIEGGAQPMQNEDGTVWLTYNGEIYNHLELRKELERRGHRFATRADTEVIVHGWEEWGEDVFGYLNGIFALALCDVRTREIVLARDPLGVKPLYLGNSFGVTWWASELGAARSVGLVRGDVAPDSLALFLTFRFVPSPHAILDGSWKLPPGHLVRQGIDEAGSEPVFRSFPSHVRSAATPQNRTEWREAVLDELEQAVRRQLMADVPVASLLSGGIDSTFVTRAMALALPEPPQAFAIGFASDGAAAETEAAAASAAAVGVPLQTLLVSDAAYIDGWPKAAAELGEPVGNTGALLLQLLCREAGQTHKVVLTGQGADEPLGGYPRHAAERAARLARHAPGAAAALVRSTAGGDASERFARMLSAPDRIDRYVEVLSVLPADVVRALVPDTSASPNALARAAVARWVSPDPPADTVNELLRVDARMSLADDLLVVADHVSMRSSVELRVPFLDLQLLELVERMPSLYKISRLGSRKWLYRQGVLPRLPSEVRRNLSRTTLPMSRKRGFSTPLERWFAGADGALARPEEWIGPLAALGPLARQALPAVLRRANARQRSVLYSLSAWAQLDAAS